MTRKTLQPRAVHTNGIAQYKRTLISSTACTIAVALLIGSIPGCTTKPTPRDDVLPLVMHDVPARRLAFHLEPDTGLPPGFKAEEANEKVEAIQTDFNTNRKDDALVRTVTSPDGKRALALYGTADEPNESFRIDLYSAEGQFLRNLTPPDLVGAFPETANWSPDGNYVTFIAHKSTRPTPSPTVFEPLITSSPDASPVPSAAPSIAPLFASVPLFNTEQIYICNRDGYELKPLTGREGLIYFYLAWAPDNHALAALACKEDEWNAREKAFKLPAGRLRLISIDGKERLLDDELTEALPAWSPDSAKVATAFDTDVGIYDAAPNAPTQARLSLRDDLLAASRIYEEKTVAAMKKSEKANDKPAETKPASDEIPASFNPIVHLEWVAPEKLYIKTAYVRVMAHDIVNTFQRWHLIVLSPQAATIK